MRYRAVLVTAVLALPLSIALANRHDTARPVPIAAANRVSLPVIGLLPELSGGTGWINGGPITRADLRGHVALIEIWTYGCINCLNALPHIKATAARYKADGLITIGVHTPEFAHEKVDANVRRQVRKLGIDFPVVMDNDMAIWRSFNNQFWPSVYVVDKQGRIRFHHDGEGRYSDIDAAVRALLAE